MEDLYFFTISLVMQGSYSLKNQEESIKIWVDQAESGKAREFLHIL